MQRKTLCVRGDGVEGSKERQISVSEEYRHLKREQESLFWCVPFQVDTCFESPQQR